MKGLSLACHEKVPCDFGLRTGDHSDTGDGAGDWRLRETCPAQHRLLGGTGSLAELRISISWPELQGVSLKQPHSSPHSEGPHAQFNSLLSLPCDS